MSKHQGLVQPEGSGKLMKFDYLIGSGTHDLPACGVVPQPLRCRVPHLSTHALATWEPRGVHTEWSSLRAASALLGNGSQLTDSGTRQCNDSPLHDKTNFVVFSPQANYTD
jgi:hypothetical protein